MQLVCNGLRECIHYLFSIMIIKVTKKLVVWLSFRICSHKWRTWKNWGSYHLHNFMTKSTLTNKNYQTCHLIGWRLWCKPIKYHFNSLSRGFFYTCPGVRRWNLQTWHAFDSEQSWYTIRFGLYPFNHPDNIHATSQSVPMNFVAMSKWDLFFF